MKNLILAFGLMSLVAGCAASAPSTEPLSAPANSTTTTSAPATGTPGGDPSIPPVAASPAPTVDSNANTTPKAMPGNDSPTGTNSNTSTGSGSGH